MLGGRSKFHVVGLATYQSRRQSIWLSRAFSCEIEKRRLIAIDPLHGFCVAALVLRYSVVITVAFKLVPSTAEVTLVEVSAHSGFRTLYIVAFAHHT